MNSKEKRVTSLKRKRFKGFSESIYDIVTGIVG
jgi:hypothetical protein